MLKVEKVIRIKAQRYIKTNVNPSLKFFLKGKCNNWMFSATNWRENIKKTKEYNENEKEKTNGAAYGAG